ncbi:LEAF RUST 10 DISEASE-RESISTANCE LOCUS RECEPTOR-LIKE PROTEIN KINASE-like 2.2 [Zea mays]|uniref:non-specific serine/threonine protein kinase n=1 Tax=Zea mays TaxID=4577 RepID=A0A3L6GAD3_MAIZE|nr:LEAF RUST 10 DISEASE-RESISTANCE LOCUS RECEPTOR-LIKE PROTEIN KINASE-like 2.2 [Zea mays]
MSSSDETTGGSIAIAIVSVITGGIVVIVVSVLIYKCCKLRMIRKYGYGGDDDLPLRPVERRRAESVPVPPTGSSSSSYGTVDVVKDRPVRFSSSQLSEFTTNYSERLGAGGFGVVYRGQIQLPAGGHGSSSSSLAVAVKVLGSNMGRRAEEQFMAEIGTIGRTSHVNLVRLYGFCFDADLKALVYEFMPNGSLDHHLFHDHDSDQNQKLGFGKLYDVAVGTAKAVRYLHDECERRIIHYDIKPGNVLLDEAFRPKVADFGLARLCERERTHVTMTGGGRGTPGYAAPELWMAAPATHKCDVYSYGMLLFEILGRRRNYVDDDVDGGARDAAIADSAERWYPRWVWQRLERGETEALAARALAGKAGKEGRKKVERLCAVALWCVQYRPDDRPSMSGVVRMLEGDEDVAAPAVSPFAHLDSDLVSSRTSTAYTTTTTFGSAA